MANGGRGFAGMSPEQQRQIASAGGRAAHLSGNAHEFTSEEAREAGRKGGRARHRGNSAGSQEATATHRQTERDASNYQSDGEQTGDHKMANASRQAGRDMPSRDSSTAEPDLGRISDEFDQQDQDEGESPVQLARAELQAETGER